MVGVAIPNRFARSIALALSARGNPNLSARRLRFSNSRAKAASASVTSGDVTAGSGFAVVAEESLDASKGRLGADVASAGGTFETEEVV